LVEHDELLRKLGFANWCALEPLLLIVVTAFAQCLKRAGPEFLDTPTVGLDVIAHQQ